jgi:hypothetical protein
LSGLRSAFDLWEEPLSETEREALLERAAEQVVKRGLQAPVIMALEMHRPLAFIASQGIIFATPLVGPLLGLERMQTIGRFLQEPGAVEALIRRIEDKTMAADAAAAAAAKEASTAAPALPGK